MIDIPYNTNPGSAVHIEARNAGSLNLNHGAEFHDANVCILAVQTNLNVDGCLFEQSVYNFPVHGFGGSAVKFYGALIGSNTNDLYQCLIGNNSTAMPPNQFNDCYRGVSVVDRAFVRVIDNNFSFSRFGVAVRNNELSSIPNTSGSIQISGNTFMNVLENGIDLMDNGNVTIQLVSNNFNMNMFNTTNPFDPASETRRGIYLHNSVDPNDDNSSLFIFDNRIMNCRTGIQIMQQQRGTVLQNDIFYRVPDFFMDYGLGVFRRGISSQNSNNINFNNNTVSRIPVNGQTNTLSELMIDQTGTQGTLMCGFSEESSANNYTDNTTIDLPTHFRIFANCNSSVFNCNGLSNGVEGFKLEGLNVQLGQQGASNNPCGNIWNSWPGAGSFNGYLRRIAGGQPISADWWYGSTPEEDPTENGNIQATPGIATQPTSGQSCQPCVPCQTDRLYALLESLDSMMWDDNTRFMAKQYIYEQIKDSLELLYSGSTHDIALQNFFSAMGLHNVGLLSSIDELLGSNDYANAILFNDDLITAELVEVNLETVNNICARYERRFDEMDSVDRSSLEMIAYQNPSIGGVAVYRARAILGIDVDDTQLAFRVGRVDPVVNDILVHIIPNPASGRFYLSFNTKSDNLVSVSVSNILSQLVIPKVEFNMMESFEIDLSGKLTGLYFANIVLPDGKEVTKKLILINEK